MKTSLGIWAFGPMITRFVPGGYQPEHSYDPEPVADKVHRAVEGLGDLIDGYEFHYPNELSPDNLDEVRAALGDHDIYCIAGGLHLDPRFGRGGLVNPDPALRARGPADRPRGRRVRRLARRAPDHLARRRGLQLPVPDAVRRLVALADRGHGRGRRGVRAPRRQAVPRAQELRAGDEDPDAQHRHVPARRPQARAPRGIDNVQINMDWQHLLMNGEHLPEYAALLRPRACSATSTPTPAGARSTTTTWSARPRSWRRSSSRSSCAAAATATHGERLGFDLYPYTEDQVGAVRRSVLQWRFIDSVAAKIDDAALREAQQPRTRCGPTSSCTRRSARELRADDHAGRDRRRHARRSRGWRSTPTARCWRAPRPATRCRRRGRAGPSRTPRTGGERPSRCSTSCAAPPGRRRDRAIGPDARARRARRRRPRAAPGDPLERPAHRRASATRSSARSGWSG